MLNKISIYLSENPMLRYWIIRPEWVAVILLILSIIASLQLSPFFADLLKSLAKLDIFTTFSVLFEILLVISSIAATVSSKAAADWFEVSFNIFTFFNKISLL